ncbi:MAG: HAMP domain-containing histidine kinase [Deltaproteobacteria bacterium]|nr:HAMP domain-containing histidine kinase [Deltaproteobacteria bacterium]
MKRNTSLSLLALAVLTPGLALCVLQYRSLVELEAKSRVAARERLLEVLGASARQIEASIQGIAVDALSPISAPKPPPGPELVSRFAALRQAQPAIREAFVIAECACNGKRFAVFSSEKETILGDRLGHERVHRILRAYAGARKLGESIKYSQATENGSLIYAFRSLNPKDGLFAGLAIDAGTLLQQVLPASKVEPIAFSVTDSGKRRIWASAPAAAAFDADVHLGPIAADWALEGRYSGASIQTLAHREFLWSLGLMALVVLCLALGTIMTVRAANREARAAALRSAFIANISHEMKTPLSLIRMFSETLEMGRINDPGKVSEYYRLLHRESRKLTSLIENVLEFGRMEAGRKEYHMAAGSVAAVVEHVMCSYEPQLRAAGFQWKTEIDRDLPPALVDADALSQAVGNLLDNAMKYSAARKSVEVSIFRRDSEVAIRVADCGIGIPPNEQERIFDRFYRAGSPLVHNTKGSGLGLAIARHIVEAHGGQIRVESTPGEGSRFIIGIPALAGSEWREQAIA